MTDEIHIIYVHHENPDGDLLSQYYLTSLEEVQQVGAAIYERTKGLISVVTLKPGKWDGKYIQPIAPTS